MLNRDSVWMSLLPILKHCVLFHIIRNREFAMFLESNVNIKGKYEEKTLEHASLPQIFVAQKLRVQFYIEELKSNIFRIFQLWGKN